MTKSLTSRIEKGQKVAGLIALYRIPDRYGSSVGAFTRVKVLSLAVSNSQVKVRIMPVDGVGEMSVEPGALIEDTPAEIDRLTRTNASDQLMSDNFSGGGLAVNKRRRFASMMDALSEEARTYLLEEAQARGRDLSKVTSIPWDNLSGLTRLLCDLTAGFSPKSLRKLPHVED
jgi:hypothetical protein